MLNGFKASLTRQGHFCKNEAALLGASELCICAGVGRMMRHSLPKSARQTVFRTAPPANHQLGRLRRAIADKGLRT